MTPDIAQDLLDTIEALQKENEQLRAQLDEWKYEVKCHMDEVIAREKQMARK
jgi:FtsZ-binding cell division protein ZapB